MPIRRQSFYGSIHETILQTDSMFEFSTFGAYGNNNSLR